MTASVRVFLEADVKCYHCGQTSGVVRRDQGGSGGATTFKAAGSDVERPIAPKQRITCHRCSGPTYFDAFEVRQEWSKVDFLEDRPRRGRPPKVLAERRGAA